MPYPVAMNVRELIEKEIKRLNISANEFAVRVGLSRGTVSNIRKGFGPDLATLIKLADYSGVSVDELAGRVKAHKDKVVMSPQSERLLSHLSHLDADGLRLLEECAALLASGDEKTYSVLQDQVEMLRENLARRKGTRSANPKTGS